METPLENLSKEDLIKVISSREAKLKLLSEEQNNLTRERDNLTQE